MPSSVDIENGGSGVCDARTRTSFRCRSQSFQEPRKFPPALPLLVRTGNGNVQMPWIFKRSYTDNGRLVIHEVKVRHHDFFRVNRSDGRLTLQLMHMDEPASPTPDSHDPTTVAEFENNEKKDKEEKRVRGSLLRPAPMPKREKPTFIAPPQDQEKKKGKESFRELKMMEERLFRLPMSSSSLALSSLAPTSTEKTDAVDSLLRQGNYRRLSDVSRVSSLPSITSSMPELLLGKGGTGGGGGGGGWLIDSISDSNSPLQVPMPRLDFVHR